VIGGTIKNVICPQHEYIHTINKACLTASTLVKNIADRPVALSERRRRNPSSNRIVLD
jgi:hypothetical protein